MDKYVIAGTKKIFSLVRIKIQLAEEAETTECRPAPLPLIKRLCGVEIRTVSMAKGYREQLVENTDYCSEKSVASAVISCMDIIEGVKYRYEPQEYMSNIDAVKFRYIESESKRNSLPLNLLIMTGNAPLGINVYVGENPPQNTIFLSGVPTSIATLLSYAFSSDWFSDGLKLKNIVSCLGHRTLIASAIHHSLGVYGAKTIDYLE